MKRGIDMAGTKQQPTWWAVLVTGESPDVYGPYRSYEVAARVADRWNVRPGADIDDWASVVPMESGPIT